MNTQIQSLIQQATENPKFSPEANAAWRRLFLLAQRECDMLKSQTFDTVFQREVEATQIVDNWIAEARLYSDHCNPDDDRVAGDRSTVGALRDQQDEFLADIELQINRTKRSIYATRFRKATKRRDNKLIALSQRLARLQDLYDNEVKCTVTQDPYFDEAKCTAPDSYITFKEQQQFEEPDSIDAIDQFERLHSSKHYFYQEPECDPEDARFNGDQERRNNGRPRGATGVLGGIYETTDPEPLYRDRSRRKYLLRAYKSSDNLQDIELFVHMAIKPANRKTVLAALTKKLSQTTNQSK
jgi:hypothetical protein